MKSARRRLVVLYALGCAVAVGTLVGLTLLVLRQQQGHARAVAEALHHEDLRTALWRMETRVGTLLATTTNRSLNSAVEAPPVFVNNWIDPAALAVNPNVRVDPTLQERCVVAADNAFSQAAESGSDAYLPAPQTAGAPDPTSGSISQQMLVNRGAERSVQEYSRRVDANAVQQIAGANGSPDPAPEAMVCVGPLAPVWESDGAEVNLHLARRVEGSYGVSHESFELDWSRLRTMLLAEIADLFPTADLVPTDPDAPIDDRAVRLAAIPVRLVVPPPLPAEGLPRGYLWTLGGAWGALLLALASGGFALRSSLAYGDKHRRFTHAVTHELRTPLTTFRMYSEMLAGGMVPEGARGEYFATLESESIRLTRLVDNVLRYARLEDGKAGPARQPIRADALLERCIPELARTCAAASASLDVQDLVPAGVHLETDPGAVSQVLLNLVENACKYGRHAGPDAPEAIVLRASAAGDRLCLEVVDTGPGVAPHLAEAIFEPFERGGRDSSDAAPGVGLGLSLARTLARELGGDLALVPAARGATFRLTLPTTG